MIPAGNDNDAVRMIDGTPASPEYLAAVEAMIAEVCDIEDTLAIWELDN